MTHPFRNILLLLPALVALVACSDDLGPDPYADQPLEVGSTMQWQCGRSLVSTRALIDPLDAQDDQPYPDWLHITMRDGTVAASTIVDGSKHPEKFLIRKTWAENDNYTTRQYVAYHDTYALSQYAGGDGGTKERRLFYSKSQVARLTPEANTLCDTLPSDGIPQAWDDQSLLSWGRTDHLTTQAKFGGSYRIEGNHLFLDLAHVTALLRLHFAVDSRYSRIRYIDLHGVTINDVAIVSEEHLILPVASATATDFSQHQLFGYAYMKPEYAVTGNRLTWSPTSPVPVNNGTEVTFLCTYDIYDKDAQLTYGSSEAPSVEAQAHRTRTDVIAKNVITLKMMHNGAQVEQIRAGYYYDLYITINPDYLYVLSDHDNKHLSIQ